MSEPDSPWPARRPETWDERLLMRMRPLALGGSALAPVADLSKHWEWGLPANVWAGLTLLLGAMLAIMVIATRTWALKMATTDPLAEIGLKMNRGVVAVFRREWRKTRDVFLGSTPMDRTAYMISQIATIVFIPLCFVSEKFPFASFFAVFVCGIYELLREKFLENEIYARWFATIDK
jgi:hypothetical protein